MKLIPAQTALIPHRPSPTNICLEKDRPHFHERAPLQIAHPTTGFWIAAPLSTAPFEALAAQSFVSKATVVVLDWPVLNVHFSRAPKTQDYPDSDRVFVRFRCLIFMPPQTRMRQQARKS
jgi:hypothetical protein